LSLNVYGREFSHQSTTVFENALLKARLFSYAHCKRPGLRETFSETVLLPVEKQI